MPFLLVVTLYVLVFGQNWSHYAAALMIYVYNRHDGRWSEVPFRIG